MNTFFCTDSIISPELDIIKTAFDFTGVELREIKGRFFYARGCKSRTSPGQAAGMFLQIPLN